MDNLNTHCGRSGSKFGNGDVIYLYDTYFNSSKTEALIHICGCVIVNIYRHRPGTAQESETAHQHDLSLYDHPPGDL